MLKSDFIVAFFVFVVCMALKVLIFLLAPLMLHNKIEIIVCIRGDIQWLRNHCRSNY